MSFRNSVFIALALVLTAPVAPASESAWPRDSASEFSVVVASLRFRMYADHCSASVPQLKPKFEILVQDLNARMQGISKGLLASDEFRDMKDKPVPAQIVDAFQDSFDDSKHNFERRDAAVICPQTLQKLGEIDDVSLESGLADVLKAVQNMIRNLEQERARQARFRPSPSRRS